MIDRVVIRAYVVAIALLILSGGYALVSAHPFPVKKTPKAIVATGVDIASAQQVEVAREMLRIRTRNVQRIVARRKAAWRRARAERLREIASMTSRWSAAPSYARAADVQAATTVSVPAVTFTPAPAPPAAPVTAAS